MFTVKHAPLQVQRLSEKGALMTTQFLNGAYDGRPPLEVHPVQEILSQPTPVCAGGIGTGSTAYKRLEDAGDALASASHLYDWCLVLRK
jgi:hypothetical protein